MEYISYFKRNHIKVQDFVYNTEMTFNLLAGKTLKYVVFVVVIILADIAGLWIYFRLMSPDVSSQLDPPDVTQPPLPSNSTFGIYSKAAVVSSGAPCAAFGRQMLEEGGSAVDAAIAVLLCDGVCVMEAMGVGGGFIMTFYNRTKKQAYSIVARETAPANATVDMYVADPSLSTFGPLAAGIPGELKGYQEAHGMFGKLAWSRLFEPTIQLCQTGVPVSKSLAFQFQLTEDKIRASPSASAVLLNSTGGRLPKEGDKIKLPLLAQTLSVIANSPKKADELYNGSLTKQFVKDIQAEGGIITEQDMNNYAVRTKDPPINASLSGNLTLYTAPLPGSGVLVAFMLRLLDNFVQLGDSDLERSQLMIETFKHAYGRRTDLGDPYFVNKTLLDSWSDGQTTIKNEILPSLRQTKE
ncbi:hypothetical protein J6590_030179 [Homalodisca vitripennis]|nr:hypothetical protein J6590_030179 [Homalodisca vitripennis]